MKDRWKFCQCCYLNGHCENQDRDMKCEHYSKQLEDKVERLQEQLADANKTIDYYDKKDFHYTLSDGTVMGSEPAHKYKIKWGVK